VSGPIRRFRLARRGLGGHRGLHAQKGISRQEAFAWRPGEARRKNPSCLEQSAGINGWDKGPGPAGRKGDDGGGGAAAALGRGDSNFISDPPGGLSAYASPQPLGGAYRHISRAQSGFCCGRFAGKRPYNVDHPQAAAINEPRGSAGSWRARAMGYKPEGPNINDGAAAGIPVEAATSRENVATSKGGR